MTILEQGIEEIGLLDQMSDIPDSKTINALFEALNKQGNNFPTLNDFSADSALAQIWKMAITVSGNQGHYVATTTEDYSFGKGLAGKFKIDIEL